MQFSPESPQEVWWVTSIAFSRERRRLQVSVGTLRVRTVSETPVFLG